MMRICTLASGSTGNCLLVETKEAKILVDAGLSGKKTACCLDLLGVDAKKIDALLITHEHQDHIKGAGILSRRYDLPIYANEATWAAMQKDLGAIAEKNQCVLNVDEVMDLHDLKVEVFSTLHDAADPVGYSFYEKETKATILTDTGRMNIKMRQTLQDADLVVLESNHDVEMLKVGSYPYPVKRRILGETGHLSNVQAGEALGQALGGEKKKVLLAHLSRENNFPELAYQTVKNVLHDLDLEIGDDLELHLAGADGPSCFLELDE